jgi:hypothetical protein
MHLYYFRLIAWLQSGFLLGIGAGMDNLLLVVLGLLSLAICIGWEVRRYRRGERPNAVTYTVHLSGSVTPYDIDSRHAELFQRLMSEEKRRYG